MRPRTRSEKRSIRAVAVGFVAVLAFTGYSGAAHAEETAPFVVTTDNLAIELSRDGRLVGVAMGETPVRRTVTGGTRLANCTVVGDASKELLSAGGIRFSRRLIGPNDGQEATLIESFRPTTDSIRWEIEIIGGKTPWTAPIETWLQWPEPTVAKWWAAWSDPRPGGGKDWNDPLVTSPFVDRTLSYAGALAGPDSFAIPSVSVLEEAAELGLTLALSPEDLVLVMDLAVSSDGRLVFSRRNHRIQAEHPVRFAVDLVTHPADWRAGLDWMVRRYPQFFDPPNPAVHELAGCGAYSSHAEINQPQRLHRMAFRVNWKASYDFPFMGMFLPPAEEWIDFKHRESSIAQMREHSSEMRRMGFHVLNYFNVTELGAHYQYPPPPRQAVSDADLWKDANDFLYYKVGDAILPGEQGKPIGSWEGCVVMDPGEPVYQAFLLEQARRHIDKLPESSGICIDRTDWVRMFNRRRDDGVSWVDGRPARALAVSWAGISERLGEIMHAAGKVIYVNLSRTTHLGWLQHVDGIYDEIGDHPMHFNRAGLLGLRKPVMIWTRTAAAVRRNPDAYFQQHLHMGVYLTAPLPGNDHTILPAEDTDQYFLDYGPLLDALRGKRWCLRPHVVEVVGDQAKANIFEVPGGYVIPITFGAADRASVVLRGLPLLPGQDGFRAEVIRPGQDKWAPLPTTTADRDALSFDAPLVRGCAMIKLAYAWVEPATAYFSGRTTIEMGTTLRDAVLRYTLDGSVPSPTSVRYEKPFTLDRTTRVRAAAFRGDAPLGNVMTTEFVDVPTDAPVFSPEGNGFDESLDVTITPPAGIEASAIRYTLDGSRPTADSPQYTGPIRLTRTASVRAAVYLPGREGCSSSTTFHGRGPKPPTPDVFLSDLTAIHATTGWGGTPRLDRSITDKPLSLAGTTYAKGIGVHAISELEYELKPDYRRFVAVVGVDDAMQSHPEASITFEVWIDGQRVLETRILRPGDYEHLNVAIPTDSQRMRLRVTHAIDGTACDHGDWAAAGFLRNDK